MLRRSLFVVVAAVVAVMAVTTSTTAVGAAVRPFNAAQTVAGGCTADSGDSVMSSGGSLFGYAECQGSLIRFFSRQPQRDGQPQPGHGLLRPGAGRGGRLTASYVLFATPVDIRIGKRTNAGVFSSRVVDTGTGGVTVPTGDVIAKDGQWFGVWAKQVGPGGEFAQMELFSAGSASPSAR